MSKIYTIPVLLIFLISNATAQIFPAEDFDCLTDNPIPFSTNETHLTIWNGSDYQPFFIKGMNMGVAIPGKFPGEMAVTRDQYSRWFQLIKDAGYNSIRLYTLHFPHFYEVLDSFNLANPHNPLFFFQGVWLEEELEGYDHDLHFLNEAFTREIEENVDCVHGNRTIAQRPGKAWGVYQTDVSRWNIGYIIGREVHPGEVLYTNYLHEGNTFYLGDHFAIEDVLPTESWVVGKLDHLVGYENTRYQTMRPVSFSSWPTQDPLSHPGEWNRWEDTTSVDLSRLQLLNAPAGFFVSYHAYPYYPDYINDDPLYQDYRDNYGPNSYLGYLTRMKEHYSNFPLIIAEFGVPSSWGVAHYSQSGMHHGGFDDYQQGENNIRMLKTMETAMCGGGIQFAWMDEWFKRTWVTDHIDYLMDRRILWHNITAAEQNFGLISFQRPLQLQNWEEFGEDTHIQKIEAAADYDFLHLKIHLKKPLSNPDELWLSLDTYDGELGESILPTGKTLENRAEFALHITNHSAMLYVTEAYDLYGIYHGVSADEQQYRSVVSDGAPWKIVRWRVNPYEQDVQYIGNLKVNYGFLPPSSKDAVTIFTDHIHIRLPWSLLHFVDPSEYVVFHDDRNAPGPQDTISDGISISVFYRDEVFTPENRFLWEKWNTALDVEEVIKGSYWVAKDRLHEFNNKAIALCDSFYVKIDGEPAFISAVEGLLSNDFDLDGNFMQALILETPENGRVNLATDGAFSYMPNPGFSGVDVFSYVVFDGYSLSEPAQVFIFVDNVTSIAALLPEALPENHISLFPNPARDRVTVSSGEVIDNIILFDASGKMMLQKQVDRQELTLDLSGLTPGMYLIRIQSGKSMQVKRVQVL
jgi:hypothetical protein